MTFNFLFLFSLLLKTGLKKDIKYILSNYVILSVLFNSYGVQGGRGGGPPSVEIHSVFAIASSSSSSVLLPFTHVAIYSERTTLLNPVHHQDPFPTPCGLWPHFPEAHPFLYDARQADS